MVKKRSIALRRPADYDLKESKRHVGPLIPVLKDKNGRLIDGLHRLHADKNWPAHTIPISGIESDIARIVVNVQRRQIPPEEKTKMLKDLAEKTGWTPEEIAEKTGMSVSWVRKYLPDEYKNKEMTKLAKKRHDERKESSRQKKTCSGCGKPLMAVLICSDWGYMAKESDSKSYVS